MRQIILSDHVSDVLDEMNKRREDRHAVKVEKYRNELKKRQDSIDERKRLLTEAWKRRKFLQVIVNALEYLDGLTIAKPQIPFREGPDEIDRKYLCGREGEQKVDGYLGARLSDEWILLSGFRNFKGEIDRILVGPGGIFSMEVKNRNGHIFCESDYWTLDKYDRYGKLVEGNIVIADGGKENGKRRGPSRQLNEPTDMLEKFLKRTLPDCRICRIIIFTHERARLGNLDNPTVDDVIFLHSGWNIESTIEKSSWRLTNPEVEKIVQKIKAYHQYMEKTMSSHRGGHKEAA